MGSMDNIMLDFFRIEKSPLSLHLAVSWLYKNINIFQALASNTCDTTLPMSGAGFCQPNVSLLCAQGVQLASASTAGKRPIWSSPSVRCIVLSK